MKNEVESRDTVIEHLGIKITIPESVAKKLDLPEVKQDLIRTCVRIHNRYTKADESKYKGK